MRNSKGPKGLTGALAAFKQVDPATGQAYATLPETEPHIPAGLPNAPFALDPYLTVGDTTSIDLTTNFYAEQQQIDDGKMDLFVAKSAAKGLTMGFFHTSDLPLATEAQKYVLCDHFFHGVFGGSLQNHIFQSSTAVAVFPNAPDSLKAVLDDAGIPERNVDSGAVLNGPLTPDGHVVGSPRGSMSGVRAHAYTRTLRVMCRPAIVISPFAKKAYVDSTVYDTTSIIALIEHRWGLAALGTRDAAAADLTKAFDFGP
jgi:phospholipase C